MLSSHTLEVIKSTIPLLETHGRTITDVFYANLLTAHPYLKNIFNMANQGKGEQSHALSNAVLAYAQNIDNLEVLLPVVERIAHKHVSLGIQAKHYNLVGAELLKAIQQVLDLPDNHPALQAWGEAYGLLANVFINAEANLYDSNQQQEGGWKGDRDFYISRIVEETPEVKSFYLKSLDLEPVCDFKGGQYVGVRVQPSDSEYFQVRQYSLSTKNREADELRISVKAQQGGVVSNHLHSCKPGDALSLRAPAGVFTLAQNKPKHIFVAGGVGITPLMSMMQEALAKGVAAQDILFIQCSRDETHQIFKHDLASLSEQQGIHYKRCFEDSNMGDHQGYLDQQILSAWGQALGFNADNAQVYFCGPKSFMAVLNQFFSAMDYKAEDIHYEVFGPTTS